MVRIHRDDEFELLRLRIETEQVLLAVRLLPLGLGEPDHPRAIDVDVVVAVPRIRQHVRLLRARAWIELDEAIRMAAIGQPDVPFGIEADVLTDAAAGELPFP